jgi:Na+/H+ antiporter NhaD/arsenite permease-like protein
MIPDLLARDICPLTDHTHANNPFGGSVPETVYFRNGLFIVVCHHGCSLRKLLFQNVQQLESMLDRRRNNQATRSRVFFSWFVKLFTSGFNDIPYRLWMPEERTI